MMMAIKANRDDAAMLWVAHILLLMLLLSSESMFVQSAAKPSHGGSGECIARERRILLQFKAAVYDTRQALSSWNSEFNPNCCKWKGISCDNVTNHVVALSLSYSGLLKNTSIEPSEILSTMSKLHNLHYLDLSGNFDPSSILDQFSSENMSLSISIPPEVGGLSHLVFLNLSGICLPSNSNVIPLQLGNLHALKVLDLSLVAYIISADDHIVNFDAPEFPTKALLSLSNLEDLRLDDIPLDNSSNSANAICKLHHLKILNMNAYAFTQPLHSCLKNLTSLTYLSLDYNDFSGSSIFNIVANMSSLVHLSASSANISHFVPTHTFSSPISHLDLSGNNLQGQFPRSFCYLTSLEYLDLSSNALKGIIPSCLVNLTRLNALLLQDNQLNGFIPSSISLLTGLTYVDLSSNCLTGTFSLSILKDCTHLKRLSLSHNSLTVNFSKGWSSLMQLQFLSLDTCNMTGGFPLFVAHHPSLVFLSLSGNNFVGAIPSWIWKFQNLEGLDISLNKFTGSIPSDMRSMRNLVILDLSSNRLYGSLPFYFPPPIDQIILSNNLFSGSLPSFTDLGEGISINLACNNISGLVPWTDIVKLNPTAFDVSQNKLKGELTLLRNMSNLVDLSLNSNNFTGTIPYLLNCSGLKMLDLGNNNMHGSVPGWIGQLSELRVLILRLNNFEGQLPQELLMLQNLHALDLSSNNLSGFLPASFENLQAMNSQRTVDVSFLELYNLEMLPDSYYAVNITTEVKLDNKGILYQYGKNVITLIKCIDVSDNQFTGEIPNEIGLLKGLIVLNMSYNHFSGKIPKSLALISELDSLDLSNNDLSGEIPPELSSLSMLGDLRLSHNNLTGKIPDEAHFETYPSSSFADNPGLCGFQINKSCSDEKNNNSLGVKAMYSKDDLQYLLYWLASGLGFGFGFAIVMILLSFHAARSRCFAVCDRIIYSTHFFILMVLARMKVLS